MATVMNREGALLSAVQVRSKVCSKNAAEAGRVYVQQTRRCLFLVENATAAHVSVSTLLSNVDGTATRGVTYSVITCAV